MAFTPIADKTTLDRVETKVDTVDTVVDTINAQIGTNADASSSTGSAHAKLKELRTFVAPASTALSTGVWTSTRAANLDAIKLKTDDIIYPTKFFRGVVNVDIAQNAFVVVANVTSGKGFLSYVGVRFPDAGSIRVTIDGVVTNISMNSADYSSINDTIFVFGYHFNIYFNTSLRVEVADHSTSTNLTNVSAHYNLV